MAFQMNYSEWKNYSSVSSLMLLFVYVSVAFTYSYEAPILISPDWRVELSPEQFRHGHSACERAS